MSFEIRIVRGDTPTLEFQFLDSSDSPLDLTGWQLYFAAARINDSRIIINKPMTVVDPPNGLARISLNEADTSQVGKFIAEVEARSGSSIATIAQGTMIIADDVRKS